MNVSKNENDKAIKQVKILTLGDSSVGKSSIILRYVNKKFIEVFQATIGLDFKSKVVENKKKKAQVLLVGNKIDLPNREVDTSEAEEIAEKCGVRYLEVSAKSGENIDEIFFNLLDLLIENYDFNEEKNIRL